MEEMDVHKVQNPTKNQKGKKEDQVHHTAFVTVTTLYQHTFQTSSTECASNPFWTTSPEKS